MKAWSFFCLNSSRLGLAAGFVLLIVGCATPKIDWNGRVGTYTYDQAVLEMGPPDKEAKLTDGTVIADWLTRIGFQYRYPVGPYYGCYGPWYYGPYYPGYGVAYAPNHFVRLIFAPNGKLKAWKKYLR